MTDTVQRKRTHVDPECPLRPGEPCTLCQAFVTGPHDCQTVRLVMEDPELRELMVQKRKEYNARKKQQKQTTNA